LFVLVVLLLILFEIPATLLSMFISITIIDDTTHASCRNGRDRQDGGCHKKSEFLRHEHIVIGLGLD